MERLIWQLKTRRKGHRASSGIRAKATAGERCRSSCSAKRMVGNHAMTFAQAVKRLMATDVTKPQHLIALLELARSAARCHLQCCTPTRPSVKNWWLERHDYVNLKGVEWRCRRMPTSPNKSTADITTASCRIKSLFWVGATKFAVRNLMKSVWMESVKVVTNIRQLPEPCRNNTELWEHDHRCQSLKDE